MILKINIVCNAILQFTKKSHIPELNSITISFAHHFRDCHGGVGRAEDDHIPQFAGVDRCEGDSQMGQVEWP